MKEQLRDGKKTFRSSPIQIFFSFQKPGIAWNGYLSKFGHEATTGMSTASLLMAAHPQASSAPHSTPGVLCLTHLGWRGSPVLGCLWFVLRTWRSVLIFKIHDNLHGTRGRWLRQIPPPVVGDGLFRDSHYPVWVAFGKLNLCSVLVCGFFLKIRLRKQKALQISHHFLKSVLQLSKH